MRYGRRYEGNAMKMESVAAVARRALRVSGMQKKKSICIPILVRIWHEDGVWNVSAFDLPIVVFDEDLEQARKHFEEAACSHFMTLEELGKLGKTANELIKIAKERGFYEHRVLPRQLIERFDYSISDHAPCAAIG
jgi:hypothetical protein